MGSLKSNFMMLLAVLMILLPVFSKGDDATPPIPSPSSDNVCKDVQCGKGYCQSASGNPFGFKCECEIGWKRTRLEDQHEDHLEFLPCVIPKCDLDYSCMSAAAPAPSIPLNSSLFDPCYWMYCGEGSCKKKSTLKYSCECNAGHENLLNETTFPCYPECAIGSNCASLGIRVRRSSSTPYVRPKRAPGPSYDWSQASLILPRSFHWIAVFLISLAMAW